MFVCECMYVCVGVGGWWGARESVRREGERRKIEERETEREIMNEYFGAYPHPGCRSVVDSQRNYFRT